MPWARAPRAPSLRAYLRSFVPPRAQADEPVDPKPKIEEACHKPCLAPWSAYEKCIERVTAKPGGTCEPWAFDYWKCIDKCVRQRGGRWLVRRRGCERRARARHAALWLSAL